MCRQFCFLSRHFSAKEEQDISQDGQNFVPPLGCQVNTTTDMNVRFFWSLNTHTHTPAKNLQGPSLHIWTSDIERNSDIKLIRHGLSFHQPKLPDMITMVCCVYYIRIVQFTCFNQRIVNLKKSKAKQVMKLIPLTSSLCRILDIIFCLCIIHK